MNRASIPRLTLPLLMLASPALADPSAANSCAKSLSPMALRIYDATAPEMHPNSDMRHLITLKVIPMVMAGELNRTTARTAATAASFCLRVLEQPQAPSPERTAANTVQAVADSSAPPPAAFAPAD